MNLQHVGIGLLQSLPYVLGLIVFLVAYRALFGLLHDRVAVQALEAGNNASGVNRFGAYMGIFTAVGIGPLLGGDSHSYWAELGAFFLSGLISVVIFMLIHRLLDKAIVRNVENDMLIKKGVMSVAVTEAAAYMAIGLVISGSFAGGGQSFWPGIGSAVLFSFLGAAVLIVAYLGYCWAWKRTGRDVDTLVGNGDMPAAIDASSVLIAIGLTLFFSTAGNFTGWGQDLVYFVIAVVSSTVLVPVGRIFASWILNKVHGQESPLARSLSLGAVTIGVGLVAGLAMFA